MSFSDSDSDNNILYKIDWQNHHLHHKVMSDFVVKDFVFTVE